MIVLASVLVLVGLIVLAYVYFADQSAPNEIVLPDTQITEPEQVRPNEEEVEGFASLNSENVVQVLQTLSKTSTYRQILNLSEYWTEGRATRIVEVYYRTGTTSITVEAAKKIQHYLTNGSTLYTWYSGDETAAGITLREDLTLEDFVGIPDYYETLQRTQILEASFLPADGQAGDRIYVHCEAENGLSYRFWINIESALLERAELLQDGQVIHEVLQRELEVMMPGDVSLNGAFLLPDGTDPFAH